MVANKKQAIAHLFDYIDIHIGSHFNQLLWHTEKIKYYESKNNAEKRMDHLNQFCNLLENDFQMTQAEVDELKVALEGKLDHFQDHFINTLLKHHENSELPKEDRR